MKPREKEFIHCFPKDYKFVWYYLYLDYCNIMYILGTFPPGGGWEIDRNAKIFFFFLARTKFNFLNWGEIYIE